MSYILLVFGFVMLIVGANLLVEGSVKIAGKFKISTMVISMTIISIGTSMPEFAIACVSSLKGSQIALSNNIGSVISTISISVGITALFYTIYIKKSISKEILRMIVMQLILLVLFVIGGGLSVVDGFIFLIIFVFYMKHIIVNAKKIVTMPNEEDLIKEEEKFIKGAENIIQNSVITLTLFIITGLIFIIHGSNFVVDAATTIAHYFSLSEAFIGVTIVALGTTLPEITTALVAAKKKEYDIIIGNVVGSGVSNVMLIVGVASIINPIHYTHTLLFQILVMLLFGLIMYKFSINEKINKKSSVVLIALYVIFVVVSSRL